MDKNTVDTSNKKAAAHRPHLAVAAADHGVSAAKLVAIVLDGCRNETAD